MASLPALPTELYEELGSICRGEVVQRGMPGFQEFAAVFNGNVQSLSKAVVCPLDAEDVSKVILFCKKHSLTLSVKAGGFGTAGWAINGDVIIDLSKIQEVEIEPPNSEGSFTSLRDVASANSKGKKAATAADHSGDSSGSESSTSNNIISSGKRRRDDDEALRRYDLASRAVHTFLQGTPGTRAEPAPVIDGDGPPPSAKRRIDTDSKTHPDTDSKIRPKLYITPSSSSPTRAPQPKRASESVTSSGSGSSSSAVSRSRSNESSNDSRSSSGTSTAVTTPSPHSGHSHGNGNGNGSSIVSVHDALRRPARKADPFAYLDEKKTQPPPPALTTMQHPFPPTSMLMLLGGAQNLSAHVEPIHPHAFVTFGAGMRQKEIDTFTANNKLKGIGPPGTDLGVPYHVPFSAHPVGSSIMLLGGFGFLSRMHGLSIDNLVEVEMVLADGRIVVVSENEYPDLWWAVRGAGPCLGVATRYKARAYPVPVVYAGNLIYHFDPITAPSLIKHFRDCVKGAPRELYANVLLTAGPPGKPSLVVVQMCYVGQKEKGQEYMSAISSWNGVECQLNEVGEKSFLHQQDSVAQVLRGQGDIKQWFIRSALISSLPDDIIHETVTSFHNTPVGCTWLFELAGGAVADFEDTCFPKSQREAQFTIAALHQWDMKFNDPRCVQTAEDWIKSTLTPVHVGGAFPSFLGRHESPERVKACFGSNWDRLREVKQFYDPDNTFRNSFWPLNASGETVEPETHEPPTPPRTQSVSQSLKGRHH